MAYLIRGAKIFFENHFEKADILVKDGIISNISSNISNFSGTAVFDMDKHFVFPGLIDVHVHLREPGFFYKETIKSGTMAAARGGFTTVCSMPNLEPVPDNLVNLKAQLDVIEKNAAVKVLPFGSISKGQKQLELSDMEELAPYVAGFSDDGFGVQRDEMMLLAMEKAKNLGKIIAAHCEDNSLLGGSAIHDGAYAEKLGITGISSESEWVQIERDIDLVRKTGCDLHICHVSTKEGVELVRKAKAEGLPVSCETAAHYLCLCDEDLRDEGSFRMNPPLRTRQDKEALIKGVQDGTVEIIASDHAPHSAEEKSGGLLGSLNGIVGLETAFPVLYTHLVKTGVISLETLIKLMHENPARRFNLGRGLSVGQPADLCVFDLDEEYEIRGEDFLSKGKSCPFVGNKVFGKCRLTMLSGKPVYIDEEKGGNPVKKDVFTILTNEKLAKDVFKMMLQGDTSEIKSPGQFVNIELSGHFLRRPISVCDLEGDMLTLIYKIVGEGTEKMSRLHKGDELDLLTGLGNGYDITKCGEKPLLIGGGVGVPPLYLLARYLINSGKTPSVVLGFNSKEDVFFENEFKALGAEVFVTTADGSHGIKGFVTDAIAEIKSWDYSFSCGPEPMLKAVYGCSEKDGQFSFEERMGCGFGACMGCSCKTKYGTKRICVEGPVLEKGEIIW